MMILRALSASLVTLLLSVSSASFAQNNYPNWGKDVGAAKDHPAIQRFAGSWIIGYRQTDWDAIDLPENEQVDNEKFKNLATIEGKVTHISYLAPLGKSSLEVFRNYEQALIAAGFKRKFSCERDCGKLFYAWQNLKFSDGMLWLSSDLGCIYIDGCYSIGNPAVREEGRIWSGTLTKNGQATQVLMYTSAAKYIASGVATTYLHIAEPKAMPSGQVSVSAKAMQTSLSEDGKIALYGLFFDTGKAEIKAESNAQLEEMAKLLRALANAKFFVVGHTDNVGNFDANQTLSMQRAQAVVNALIAAPHSIDAKRLSAKGAANIMPVASNTEEAGRARNRRVELVAQ